MEAAYMSTDRWMDKEVVVHIHKGILLSHKREHIWVSYNKVGEPTAYCTEFSKSEKNKYHILMHIYRIWKNGTEEFAYRAAMEKHI